MIKNLLCAVAIAHIILCSSAQSNFTQYYGNISRADSFLYSRIFDSALTYYRKSFGQFPELVKGREIIRSIRPAIVLKDSTFIKRRLKGLDSANQVDRNHIDADTYAEIQKILTDSIFSYLKILPEWVPVAYFYSDERIKANPLFMDSLSTLIEKMYDADQVNRLKIDSLYRTHANITEVKPMIDSISRIIGSQDSLNISIISRILQRFGWLGIEKVGFKANTTLFSVIQHADLQPQIQIQFLPLLEKASLQGKARGQYFAMLKDRISMRESGKQCFGTQVMYNNLTGKYEPSPLMSSSDLNILRASVGLIPIEFYLQMFHR